MNPARRSPVRSSSARAAALAGALVGAAALTTACATTSVRRGASPANIHDGVRDVLVDEGYTCKAGPDLSFFNCTHPEKTDLGFAYLPASNLLQLWTVFSRDDEGLVPRWKTGPCEPLAAEISKNNDEVVSKLVCAEKSFRFEVVTWVPEGGLSNADIAGAIDVFRTIVGESIRSRGFLPETGASPAAAATTEPTAT
jgi:hypothetical protein